MNYLRLEPSVTLALHWTDRVKSLSPTERRKVNAEGAEHYHYMRACNFLFGIYSDMIDPNTVDHGKDADTCARWAFEVECMIYRLVQRRAIAVGKQLEEVDEMLGCLQFVSAYFLPRAVPGMIQFDQPAQSPASQVEQWGVVIVAATAAVICLLRSIYF